MFEKFIGPTDEENSKISLRRMIKMASSLAYLIKGERKKTIRILGMLNIKQPTRSNAYKSLRMLNM